MASSPSNSKGISNPFVQEFEPERYHLYRPIYHDLPFQKLRAHLGHNLIDALDVACGTGHSTEALSKISRRVTGCDSSSAMLDEARKHYPFRFVECPAEQLPFPAEVFDLVNISMAIHWTDQERFLSEAHRVLRPEGWLSIDCYGFTGKMEGREGFEIEFKNFDHTHYPPAPRNKNYPDEDLTKKCAFEWVHDLSYSHWVPMDMRKFINYLMTRSNHLILTPDEQSRKHELLLKYYTPLFGKGERRLLFSGLLKLYRKI